MPFRARPSTKKNPQSSSSNNKRFASNNNNKGSLKKNTNNNTSFQNKSKTASSRFQDEEIDDDFAFNDDDEEEFGAFFAAQDERQRQVKLQASSSSSSSKQQKGKKSSKSNRLTESSNVGADDDDDFDDDDSYESISDLLDNNSDDFRDVDDLGDDDDDLLGGDSSDFYDKDFANSEIDENDDETQTKKESIFGSSTIEEAATTTTTKTKKSKNKKGKDTSLINNSDLQLNESLFSQTSKSAMSMIPTSGKGSGGNSTSALFSLNYSGGGSGGSSSNNNIDTSDLVSALSSNALAQDDAARDRLKKVENNKKKLALLQQQQQQKKKKKGGQHELDDDDENDDDATFQQQQAEALLRGGVGAQDLGVLVPEASQDVTQRSDRKQTRAIVGEDLEKWKEFLRQQRKQRSQKFPLKAPDQNPTVSTLGGLANAVQHRQLEHFQQQQQQITSSNNKAASTSTTAAGGSNNNNITSSSSGSSSLDAAQNLALQANALLGASGYGTTQAQKAASKKVAKNTSAAAANNNNNSGDFIQFQNEDDVDDNNFGIDPSELQATREHVAKLKSVLGYEVARRRRLNRIKSKAYRRILRLEKSKQVQKRVAAEALLNPERAQRRLQEKMDRQRAEERVLQRHKNTSKWIQHVKHAATFDANAKTAIQEQHRQHALLMQKAQEPAAYDDNDDDNDGGVDNNNSKNENNKMRDDDADDERVVDALFAGAGTSALWGNEKNKNKRNQQQQDEDQEEDEDDDEQNGSTVKSNRSHADAQKKLVEMSFMKRAQDKNKREYEDAAKQLAHDIARARGEAVHDVSGENKNNKSKNSGRHKFEAPSDNNNNNNNNTNNSLVLGEQQQQQQQVINVISPSAQSNNKKKDNNNSSGGVETQNQQQESSGTTTGLVKESGSRRQRMNASTSQEDNNTNNTESENRKVDRQDYLISRAFAQDELDEDFDKKKTSQVEHIMKPDDANASLPGWGDWGGNDARLDQRHKQRVAENAMKRRMEKSTLMSARADASLDNVIINHDVDLVPSRQMLHMVPRPFADATEFHRSMRQPVGPEWTTPQSFKRQVAPKIVARAGVAIDPVDNTTGLRKKTKTQMQKGDLAKTGNKLGMKRN